MFQDRATKEGVVQSIVHFEKTAGVFQYLATHFSHAPSQDMHQDTLSMLVSLMLVCLLLVFLCVHGQNN